jgi:hypothetical protein
MLSWIYKLRWNLFWSLGPIIKHPNIDRRIPLYEIRPMTLKREKWNPVTSILTALRRDNEPRCVYNRSRLRFLACHIVFVNIRMHVYGQMRQTFFQKLTCKTDSSQPNLKLKLIAPCQKWTLHPGQNNCKSKPHCKLMHDSQALGQ